MTAPIFEPSPERTDAGLQYGDQQLFRRPAPTPAAAGPAVFTAYTTVNATYATGVQNHPTFEYYENGDTTVFGPDLVSGAVNKLRLLKRGVYTITITPEFTTTNTWNTEITVLTEINADLRMTQTFPAGSNDHVSNMPTFSVTKQFPCSPNSFFGCEPVTSPYARLYWYIAQMSGVNKTFDDALMHVVFHGETTIGT